MKRMPSNRMPQYVDRDPSVGAYLLLLLILCGPCYLILSAPWYATAGIVGVVAIAMYVDRVKQKRIADQRDGESLCTFARSFDYRSIDTWIIRAVYEQVQPLVDFPLRKTDRFDRELDLYDDLEELAEEVAQRTGRPLANCESNPWYGKVNTLEDFVAFFSSQPQVLS